MQGSFRNSEGILLASCCKQFYFGYRNNKKSWLIYVWYSLGWKWLNDSKGWGRSWRNWDKGGEGEEREGGKGEERGGGEGEGGKRENK